MNANKNFYILTIWVLTLHYIVTHVISNHLHFFINLPKFPLTSKKNSKWNKCVLWWAQCSQDRLHPSMTLIRMKRLLKMNKWPLDNEPNGWNSDRQSYQSLGATLDLDQKWPTSKFWSDQSGDMAVLWKPDSEEFITFIPKHYVGQMTDPHWAIINLDYYKTLHSSGINSGPITLSVINQIRQQVLS